MNSNRILIYLDSLDINIYLLDDNKLNMIYSKYIDFRCGFDKDIGLSENKLKELDGIFEKLKEYVNIVNSETVKLYAVGIFQSLNLLAKEKLVDHIYINHELFFNIVPEDLERFYRNRSKHYNNTQDMISGLIIQEFRSVVICGSFRKYITHMSSLITQLRKREIEILSPFSTEITIESKNDEFVLFNGEKIRNERDSWRLKHEHMRKFKKADAIIICNPKGYFGEGTIFEIGNIVALDKRVIFMEKPKQFSIYFPYEIGINF